MDFRNLILAGFCDENNREQLADYFYKEFKNAEQKYFSSELFFGGCLKEVESFENYIKRSYNEQKSVLYNLQSLGSDEGKEFARTELETISLNDFPIPLNPYTSGRYNGHLFYSEIQYIKKSITESKIRVKLESEKEKLKKISKSLNSIIENEKKNQTLGFTCNLHPETVKEIFNSMVTSKQISGNLTDFQAIFSNTQTPVKSPVKWLVLHNRKPNKSALFTFIKLMLNPDELPREILRQANNLFMSGNENIFSDKYSYPSNEEQKSSIVNHFKPIKELIKKTRPV